MSKEKDDFWDIEKLLPKKRKIVSSFSSSPKSVEYTLGDKEEQKEDNRLTVFDSKDESNVRTYNYDRWIIKSVTVTGFQDKYDFYGNFRKAALVYYDFKTSKCEFVHFYSYMPQYSQFNSEQKRFYFYWRDCVRRKKYIKTDYSYVLLYIYEILNLPDKIPAEAGVEILIDIWRAYRKDFPNIDACMSLWLQDYCLIYNLPCPTEKISDFIFEIIGLSEFKEFYLADARCMGDRGVDAMIAYLSDYDWRQGRYAGGESRDAYEKHLLGAMKLLLEHLWSDGDIANNTSENAVLTRNAFRNSLCTHSVKCRLDIEYVPFSTADDIRHSVTAAVRYTENKLRALIGVKSRLAVKDLPDKYKKIIDSYFADKFERHERERKKAALPEYEKQYDAQSTELSLEGADEIERLSWITTARLVPEEDIAFSNDSASTVEIENTDERKSEKTDELSLGIGALTYGLSKTEIAFVKAILSFDYDEAERISAQSSTLDEILVEKINEAFADNFGDVIIEGSSREFNIIEDYKEDVEEWLSKITK
ncbi:MAG: hypothetical protein E7612_01210 [Ruminococcaceae bacterium]|nr:hypothetical protein [Oscillospiraceae bacterium]